MISVIEHIVKYFQYIIMIASLDLYISTLFVVASPLDLLPVVA